MTVFEVWVLALLTVGVAAVCFYLWWGYRHDTALTERDQAVAGVAAAEADIERANVNLSTVVDQHETTKRELDQVTSLYATEADRCLELEQRIAYMIDPDDITPGIERLNQLGQAAYTAWQQRGGKGRSAAEVALLEHFAPQETDA